MRGSGKAADLISDAVQLLRVGTEQTNHEQPRMWRLLEELGVADTLIATEDGQADAGSC